jgi:hypothetical protein
VSKKIVLTLALPALAAITPACNTDSLKRRMDISDQDKTVLAECLTAKGAKLYVTNWCGACRTQKAMFGTAVSKLTIIDCESPNRSEADRERCRAIQYIPTWIFRDGRQLVGCQEFRILAKYAGCRIP